MEFLESNYLYLGLLLFSMAYPIAQSFEWRLQYYKKWKFLFPSIAIMCAVFIPWDVWFTAEGVWYFNHDYTLGIDILGLPLEEWLFFIVVPFACVFIYEVLNFFFKKDYFYAISLPIYILFAVLFLILAIVFHDRLYPFVTCSLSFIGATVVLIKKPKWRGRFLFMYFVSWLPFLLINGALTGNFTSAATVNYNPEEIIGLRVTSIPVEDSIYNFLMLLMTVSGYEYFQKKIECSTWNYRPR